MKTDACKTHLWPRLESFICIRGVGVVKVSQCNNCLALLVVFRVDGAEIGIEEVKIVEPTIKEVE